MTPTTQTLFLLLVLALLFTCRNHGVDRLRCTYCGQINGHEEHCPYGGSGI